MSNSKSNENIKLENLNIQNIQNIENIQKNILKKKVHSKKDLQKILSFNIPKYSLIALIKLEKYEEAYDYLKSLDLNTKLENLNFNESDKEKNNFKDTFLFLEAYLLYKTKKFEESIKILESCNGIKKEILLAQNFYFLEKYEQAYEILKECPYEKERDVNLQAIESLIILREKMYDYSTDPGKCKNKKFRNFVDKKDFGDLNIYGKFNDSFKIPFYDFTTNLDLKNELIKNQYLNYQNKLDENKFKEKKKNIILYNKKKMKIKRILLQKDFLRIKNILKNKSFHLIKDQKLKNLLSFLDGKKSDEIMKSVEEFLGDL